MIRRIGAKPGDLVFVIGPLATRCGLALLKDEKQALASWRLSVDIAIASPSRAWRWERRCAISPLPRSMFRTDCSPIWATSPQIRM